MDCLTIKAALWQAAVHGMVFYVVKFQTYTIRGSCGITLPDADIDWFVCLVLENRATHEQRKAKVKAQYQAKKADKVCEWCSKKTTHSCFSG